MAVGPPVSNPVPGLKLPLELADHNQRPSVPFNTTAPAAAVAPSTQGATGAALAVVPKLPPVTTFPTTPTGVEFKSSLGGVLATMVMVVVSTSCLAPPVPVLPPSSVVMVKTTEPVAAAV